MLKELKELELIDDSELDDFVIDRLELEDIVTERDKLLELDFVIDTDREELDLVTETELELLVTDIEAEELLLVIDIDRLEDEETLDSEDFVTETDKLEELTDEKLDSDERED